MSDDLIKRARELLEKTTPGPWRWESEQDIEGVEWSLMAPDIPHVEPIIMCGIPEICKPEPKNAEFIVFARNHLAEILDLAALALLNLKEAWRERMNLPADEPIPAQVVYLAWNQTPTPEDIEAAQRLITEHPEWAEQKELDK